MSNFFPLRDLSGRQIPGMANVVELPKGLHPSDYEDGVYVIGEIYIPITDMDKLNPFERASLLRHQHMLLYGHKGREMQLMESQILKRVALSLAIALPASQVILYRLFG